MLDGRSRGKRARAEQIVAAAVPRAAGDERVRLGLPRRLRQRGERVEFAQNADHGRAVTIAAAKGRVDPAEPFCHRKAQLLELLTVERGGLEFL